MLQSLFRHSSPLRLFPHPIPALQKQMLGQRNLSVALCRPPYLFDVLALNPAHLSLSFWSERSVGLTLSIIDNRRFLPLFLSSFSDPVPFHLRSPPPPGTNFLMEYVGSLYFFSFFWSFNTELFAMTAKCAFHPGPQGPNYIFLLLTLLSPFFCF